MPLAALQMPADIHIPSVPSTPPLGGSLLRHGCVRQHLCIWSATYFLPDPPRQDPREQHEHWHLIGNM